ncbi:MAG: phosphate butyryltransferase [Deltaproteobacteria bacterium]|nr:phosphate butyryltransferase [Deltaproteobacteria bacterium]
MLKNFEDVRKAARQKAGFVMVVAAAEDEASIKAAVESHRRNLARAILVGRASQIRELVRSEGGDPTDFEILDSPDEQEAAATAARMASEGKAHVILKGHLPSSTLLRAVLDRKAGLRTGRILSDVRLFDHPYKPEGFLAVTDGGVIPEPTFEQKRAIVENAVWVYHRLGFKNPLVAMLCASEKVNPGLRHTVEAAKMAELNRSGEISGCVVDGPLSLDLAIIEESVRTKGFESPVAGRADILVGPTIDAVNFLGKGLVYFKGAVPGQVIVGTKVPVLIPSRSDKAEVKFNSIALAAVVALDEETS